MVNVFYIITGGESAAIAVPDTAVVYEADTARVWVANEAGKTLGIRPIRIGRISNGMVEVLDGLDVDDKIVTQGSLFIDRAASGN